jgi:hypothetical protein
MKRSTVVAVVGALAALVPGSLAGAAGAGGAAAAAVSIVHRPVLGGSGRHDNFASTNWSGYAVTSSSAFSDVVGNWVQPTATCKGWSPTYAAFWVGIDGYNSGSVEQLGTDAECSFGRPSYYAWYEMYPAASVTLSTRTYPVHAGDTLSGGVTLSGTNYTLSLTDTSGGKMKWSYSTVVSGTNANSSAEWIAEAPEVCNFFGCSLANLTNFGTVSFTGADAALGGANAPVSSFTTGGSPHVITMVTSSGATKAKPSGLSATGDGFSDAWAHS